MTIFSQREFLKVQILEVENLLRQVEDHPLMGRSYASRVEELREALEALPAGAKEAKVDLYFTGDPVKGSQGIDAQFAGRILDPFQHMVMADFADRHHGVVGMRGKRPGEANSRLMITSMPRGSVGFELSRMDGEDIFEEEQLADTLHHVAHLMSAAASNDEEFAAAVEDVSPRVIQNLRDFLDVAKSGNAGVKVETGDYSSSIPAAKVREAFERVDIKENLAEAIVVKGVLRGIFLESRRFEFVTEKAVKISGRMDPDLPSGETERLAESFINKPCFAGLTKTRIIFRNGRERTAHVLHGMVGVEEHPPGMTPSPDDLIRPSDSGRLTAL